MKKLALVGVGLFALVLAVPAAAAAAETVISDNTALVMAVAALPAVQVTVPPDVNNPSGVAFTCSADHALVSSYEADIMRPDSTLLQTLNLGKPTPDATNTCTANINVQPVAFAVGYSLRARAIAGTAKSDDAPSLNKFNRVPGAPSKVIAK